MTNEEIDAIIVRQQFALGRNAAFTPAILWFGSFILAGFTFSILSIYWALFTFCVLAGVSLLSTFEGIKKIQKCKEEKARLIWERFGHEHTFGSEISLSTRQLGTEIQKIYRGEPSGKLFPLRQAIRLVDTHNRQQQRLAIVENRLGELRGLQEKLSSKLAQLRELGEDYPQGAHNLEQINGDLAALGRVHGQISASCARLEAIVIGVQKVAQSRQLRAELEGLSARVAPSSEAVEPAFEAESLEEIERQIGREIETYLQLERETDEHLR